MNWKHFCHLVVTVLLCTGFLTYAQEEEAGEQLEVVPQALKNATYVNKAKPNLQAKIYFVYQSRSKCSICVSETPALVKEYKKMKRRGCEMVMMNVDASPEVAAEWAKNSKMEFPVMSPAMCLRAGIPWDYTGTGLLPCMIAMTPDGTKLEEAGGSQVSELVKNWKKLLTKVRREEAKKAAAAKKAEKARKKKKAQEDEEE